jgi:hypothetical protein
LRVAQIEFVRKVRRRKCSRPPCIPQAWPRPNSARATPIAPAMISRTAPVK